MKRWPLVLIAAPAAVAVWSGWVGLGGKCGFGPVDLLPGIAHLTINTAITLPVGVEAYGAYALGAWLAPVNIPARARRFAKRSAIGALTLGMLGQVAYHLLAAAGRTRAPWPVVVLVSCIPVIVLGFGAGLTHLMRTAAPLSLPVPDPYPAEPGRPAPDAEMDRLIAWLTRSGTDVPGVPERHSEAVSTFAEELSAGTVPSIRAIRRQLQVGQDRAYEVQAYLRTLVSTDVAGTVAGLGPSRSLPDAAGAPTPPPRGSRPSGKAAGGGLAYAPGPDGLVKATMNGGGAGA